MRGILFGEKHTGNDWNLLMTSKDVGFPETKTETTDIPGADGSLDFSESLTGDVKYNERELEFNFFVDIDYKEWYVLISEIANYLHGQKLKIILDDDPNFYYYGRAKINQFKTDRNIGTLTITCEVDPYKYDLTASNEEWLWDPFSFVDGIINETNELEVDGTLEVIIYGRRKKVVPKFTCSTEMTVTFNDTTYTLPERYILCSRYRNRRRGKHSNIQRKRNSNN